MRRGLILVLTAVLLAGTGAPGAAGRRRAGSGGGRGGGPGDATVVAVLDFGFSPYHWDFSASKMPQQTDALRSNDLPLSRAPHTWLPGFPEPKKAFKSYTRFDLTLEENNKNMPLQTLDAADKAKWDRVKGSEPGGVHYYWMPDTKVIGAISFGTGKIHAASNAHGMGTTSVSVGNIHGTCPECLLFFLDLNGASRVQGEAAIDWAMSQPWIDAITNSYGYSAVNRDRIYSGSNTVAQRRASDRGQTIFFSAGNGQENAFLVPNTTIFSSQEGPDWIVTVGAVSPSAHASYTGHGKPADIASIGSSYPSAYNSPTVSGEGTFGGTSNATPVIAGTYARGLYLARSELAGASRVQGGGIVARGPRYRCGRARPKCELRDGKLTAKELRTRLFLGAVHTPAGLTPGGFGAAPPIGEDEFISEGHGSYFARETKDVKAWLEEFARLIGPLLGRDKALKRPEGEREWMIVDSFCRQHLWGRWTDGYYVDGKTKLPGDDTRYPVRSAMERSCPSLEPPG